MTPIYSAGFFLKIIYGRHWRPFFFDWHLSFFSGFFIALTGPTDAIFDVVPLYLLPFCSVNYCHFLSF
jgi:hypothetical protein